MAVGRPKKEFEIDSSSIVQPESVPVANLASVFTPTMDDIEIAQPGDEHLEKFMQEPVTIVVSYDGTPGSLKEFDLCVNGMKQRIFRGMKQTVRRFFVESLARSRIVDYEQHPTNYQDPTSMEMRPMAQVSYPFTVVEDKNPKGREWLENILRQK